VLQLRVVCPTDLTEAVVAALRADIGCATLALHRGAAVLPEGDVVLCEVVRERANAVVVALRAIGVERRGAISIVEVDALASSRGRAAERAAPGHELDALPWALVEERARDDSELSVTFFALMALAAVIAAVGIIVDSAVLIIGAMIVGPEFGPLISIAVGVYRRHRFWMSAVVVLGAGLATAIAAAVVVGLGARVAGESGSSFEPASRFFTGFVTEPNAYSAVVALAAGVAGTISLARTQATALAGVLVSVTTIPAAAAIGIDAAAANWGDLGGASLQLAINLSVLLIAAAATLAVYGRAWSRSTPPAHRPPLP
jgi:uncharacterized hydrophobic protein (TIGR00271 family)